ncbi:MAG: AbrB/MazE/SpoVT family DNA-binding domain-containing protein [Bacilli bacterium]|jgi:AbrB family looped-hinge helix DNA binding protein|nr:AbrB/MazE/SpoVT family DNA-binding domain-containing protein [Bacilli bacterium]MDD3422120.1 AbrB/MazE/SpoVT family DNA-binding domain-containing protein [Bacilli bacterium]MDD4065420.1 AbrB/MazE/SpoVT family DNA-binding domain-containing protein [Bacilli bacterium]
MDKFITSVKVGPKGQIVIPKEVREIFDIKSGDSLVILANKRKGIGLVKMDDANAFILKTLDRENTKND